MEERYAPGEWDSIRWRVALDLRSGAARPILPQQALPHTFCARFLMAMPPLFIRPELSLRVH